MERARANEIPSQKNQSVTQSVHIEIRKIAGKTETVHAPFPEINKKIVQVQRRPVPLSGCQQVSDILVIADRSPWAFSW